MSLVALAVTALCQRIPHMAVSLAPSARTLQRQPMRAWRAHYVYDYRRIDFIGVTAWSFSVGAAGQPAPSRTYTFT